MTDCSGNQPFRQGRKGSHGRAGRLGAGRDRRLGPVQPTAFRDTLRRLCAKLPLLFIHRRSFMARASMGSLLLAASVHAQWPQRCPVPPSFSGWNETRCASAQDCFPCAHFLPTPLSHLFPPLLAGARPRRAAAQMDSLPEAAGAAARGPMACPAARALLAAPPGLRVR